MAQKVAIRALAQQEGLDVGRGGAMGLITSRFRSTWQSQRTPLRLLRLVDALHYAGDAALAVAIIEVALLGLCQCVLLLDAVSIDFIDDGAEELIERAMLRFKSLGLGEGLGGIEGSGSLCLGRTTDGIACSDMRLALLIVEQRLTQDDGTNTGTRCF